MILIIFIWYKTNIYLYFTLFSFRKMHGFFSGKPYVFLVRAGEQLLRSSGEKMHTFESSGDVL